MSTIETIPALIAAFTANNPDNVKMDWLEKHGFLDSDKDFVQAYDKSLVLADYQDPFYYLLPLLLLVLLLAW